MNDFIGSDGGGCAETRPTQTYGNRESTDGRRRRVTGKVSAALPPPRTRRLRRAVQRGVRSKWSEGRTGAADTDSAARTF